MRDITTQSDPSNITWQLNQNKMSIKSLYPTTRPSLYFNFRNPEKLDMKLEHYREDTPGLITGGDSSATYVDKMVLFDIPHYIILE